MWVGAMMHPLLQLQLLWPAMLRHGVAMMMMMMVSDDDNHGPSYAAFPQALVHITPVAYLASLCLSVIGGSLFNVLCGFMVRLVAV